MSKKAQGLSMNVIIIAAIALLVLIILAVLLLRSLGGVTRGTDCSGVGGVCTDDAEGCRALAEERGGTWVNNPGNSGIDGGCPSDDYLCCVLFARGEPV